MRIAILCLLLAAATTFAGTLPDNISTEIARGNFKNAQEMLQARLCQPGVTPEERLDLGFEIDRLDRIRKDFPRTQEQVLTALRKYFPTITAADLAKYESDRSLEMMIIDGEKRYFKYAVPNLFRINKEAKKIKQKVDGPSPDQLTEFLSTHLPAVLAEARESGRQVVKPVQMKLKYTLTVDANAVPEGEMIRCWLPFPHEGHARQSAIRLLSTTPAHYVLAGNEQLQRTLYVEKVAVKDVPTVFVMELAYTCASEYHDLAKEFKRTSSETESEIYRTYTAERPPHIVFTSELRELSRQIVGDITDPLEKARRIFAWVDANVPWASAREYSTIPNISMYALENRHGDCGIQTLLFMTLARLNGIPARWQSGWMLHPVEVNLHDWCEIYLEGAGWVPVDQSFGLQPSDDPAVRNFYLGGIDSYRLIVNDDFSAPLYPAKIYPRSETVDFQRGEVEWRGGNLYFDKWDYHMDVEYEKKD